VTTLRPAFAHPAAVAESAVEQLEDLDVVARWGHVSVGSDNQRRYLEAANLIATARRGREKLHFINPVPIHEIYERWVRKFEKQRLTVLRDLKTKLEGNKP